MLNKTVIERLCFQGNRPSANAPRAKKGPSSFGLAPESDRPVRARVWTQAFLISGRPEAADRASVASLTPGGQTVARGPHVARWTISSGPLSLTIIPPKAR